ncbi:MAG: hypothetical protein ACXU95_17085 [Isosphaeraceae bacterium]
MDTKTMPNVRLRVAITIDIDALDYLEAAEHQKRLETCLSSVRCAYPEVAVSIKERRGPRPGQHPTPRRFHLQSGRLHAYD